jgi:hypothetical protein
MLDRYPEDIRKWLEAMGRDQEDALRGILNTARDLVVGIGYRRCGE